MMARLRKRVSNEPVTVGRIARIQCLAPLDSYGRLLDFQLTCLLEHRNQDREQRMQPRVPKGVRRSLIGLIVAEVNGALGAIRLFNVSFLKL